MLKRFERRWRRGWMRAAYVPLVGRTARRLARWGLPPYTGCVPLSRLHRRGYLSPDARLWHDQLSLGAHCFIGDRVLIYQDKGSSSIELGDAVQLHEHVTIQAGADARVHIGDHSHIQPRCQLSAYVGSLTIGRRAEIAANCAFYTYNHGIQPGRPIRGQPVHSVGGIVIEDDVWLGYGVIVLDGARIGAGAVISAGSVVGSAIPAGAVAGGVPARVLGFRHDFAPASARPVPVIQTARTAPAWQQLA